MIGVIDPSHYERARARAGRLPKWLTMEEALNLSAVPNPKWSPWTFELIKAALGEHQERGKRISTTTMTTPCPRQEVLKRSVDYVGSLDDMYAPLRGTMVHRTLEHSARLGAIAEARFFTTVDEIELSCSPDLVTENTVYDYKVPVDASGVPTFGYPFRHQTDQLMTNAFILRHAERWELPDGSTTLPFDPRENPVSHAVIVYLGPKGPKVIEWQRMEEFVTPTGAKRSGKRAYVWNDDEVLNGYDKEAKQLGGMRAQLHLMYNALHSYPEWPEPWENVETGEVYTAEQVWGGPKGWKCPGPPLCRLPDCLARREPDMYAWESPE